MVNAYLKTVGRMFRKHITRFFSIILIVLISVGFVSGVGSSAEFIYASLSDYYTEKNVSDLILKSTAEEGFSDEEIALLRERYGAENVNTGMSVDVTLTIEGEERLIRLYFLDSFGQESVNMRDVAGSQAGTGSYVQAAAEESDNKLAEIPLGTVIELSFADILTQLAEENGTELAFDESWLDSLAPVSVEVTSCERSPLTFALDGEPSYLNPADTPVPDTVNAVNELITLDGILYLPYSAIPSVRDIVPEQFLPFVDEATLDTPLLGRGDAYVAFSDRTVFRAYSAEYETYLAEECAAAAALVGGAEVITLEDNYSFVSLKSYADKVLGIGYVLMVAFLFVTALVALSTMTRLLEEERGQIACMKTLGYSAPRIVIRYLFFAMIATGIGGVAAYFVGTGVAQLIYIVFNYSFAMPPMPSAFSVVYFLITFAVVALSVLIATAAQGGKLSQQKPADLLRPRVPKAGKKVFLERIPIIWSHLSFKYKSTLRNVLRYRNRFLMTVIAVAIATALVLAGLALLDICLTGTIQSVSVMGIAILVVVFAGLLTAVVIYTLTNINISERNRELATLMVLGYYNNEVASYIYREIYIDTVVGIIFGYPLSLLLIRLLFWIIGMGTLAGVSWYVWLLAPVLVLLFTFLVTLLLRRKIVRIDMNESLKAIE